MKTIKSLINILLSVAIFILDLQVLLALIVTFVPTWDIAELQNADILVTGQIGLVSLSVLLIHNFLWILGLSKVKRLVKDFQVSDLMTQAFANTLKKAGLFVLVTELFSSYLATIQAPEGTYLISVKHGVYLIIAGFACDYAHRYMLKKGLSL